MESINPSNGEVICKVYEGDKEDKEDVDLAVHSAK